MTTTMPTLLPVSRDHDGEDTRWALSTAAALSARGEWDDALKWLHRAAEGALDIDDRPRRLELMNAVRALASTVEARGTLVPRMAPGISWIGTGAFRPRIHGPRATPPPKPLRAAAPSPLPPPRPRGSRLPHVSPAPLPSSNAARNLHVAVWIVNGVAELHRVEDGEVPAGAAMAVLVPLHDSDAVKLSAWLPIATPRAHEAREERRR